MSSEAQEISEAVSTWLHYQSLTGLKGLLSEALMTIPIAEYLSSVYGREVKAEVDHPLLKKAQVGRPNQIDFVRMKSGEKTWHAAYETKFQTQSYLQIALDLCRLVYLAQNRGIGSPTRYFIYGAKVEKDGAFLNNLNNTGEGPREILFDRVLEKVEIGKERKFRFSQLPRKGREPFVTFSKHHSIPLPSMVETKLVGKYRSGLFLCAVWQVLASRGSTLIYPNGLDG